MPTVFLIVLVAVNLAFAIRSLIVANGSRERVEPTQIEGEAPLLSIVVPARDEERQIETCVRSLLVQSYPNFEVIVVDDRSEDATPEILQRLAAKDDRLRIVSGRPMPDGWVGKPWALSQGFEAASGTLLLSTDADTEHDPDAVSSAIVYLLRNKLGALSLLTDQVMISPAERVVLPSILWTIAFGTGPLKNIADPNKPQVGIFNGQYVLMPRVTYEQFGGYETLRSEIAEDFELARLLKSKAIPIALVGAAGLVRTRMYRSFSEIWAGFVKNFALGVRGKPWSAALAIVFFSLLSIATPLLAIADAVLGRSLDSIALIAAMILSAASADIGMRRTGMDHSGLGWTLPAGMPVMLAIFVTSLVAHARGGVTWRGRRYMRSA